MDAANDLDSRLALSAINYKRYLRDIRKYPILPNDEIIELIRQSRDYKNGTSESRNEARNKILVANQRLVISIASGFARKRLGALNDLTQEGTIGMMRAISKFKLKSKNKFSTYATWWIRQTIMRAISEKSRTIYLPVNRADLIGRLRKQQELWLARYGRLPEVKEVAEYFGFSQRRAASLVHDSTRDSVLYLEEMATPANYENWSDYFVDQELETAEERIELDWLRDAINGLLEELDPKDRLILEHYFGLNGKKQLVFEKIAKKIGCSRQYIQYREKKLLTMLRKKHPELRRYLDRF